MKKVKQLKGWGIFQNNSKERDVFGFDFTVLHPENMEVVEICSPADSDIECYALSDAISWVENY